MSKLFIPAHSSIYWRLTIDVAAFALLSSVVRSGAVAAELSTALIAPGTLAVDSGIKKAQHLTGAIVSDRRVHGGDLVKRKILSNYDATPETDTVMQSSQDDSITVTQSSEISGTDFFDGSGGFNSIIVGPPNAGNTVDLSTAGIDETHGFHNYGAIVFRNDSGTQTAIFKAEQFGSGLISYYPTIIGTSAAQTVTINGAKNFSAGNWTFSNWTPGSDNLVINGTDGEDVIGGSNQGDIIVGGTGFNRITGGGGPDTLLGGPNGDLFFIDHASDLVTAKVIDGGVTDSVRDELQLRQGGTYDFSTLTGISSIESITLFAFSSIGYNIKVDDTLVSTAEGHRLVIGAIHPTLHQNPPWTIDASRLTSGNQISLNGFSGSYGGALTVKGGAGDDVLRGGFYTNNIDGGAGSDFIEGSQLAYDVLVGGLGADTFGFNYPLSLLDKINGTAEAGTIDRIQLPTHTWDFTKTKKISYIDEISLQHSGAEAGYNITISNSLASTADSTMDGRLGDLAIRAIRTFTTAGVTINAASLTGNNRIIVDGTKLEGGDTITGGAGDDVLDGGLGTDALSGKAGSDTIIGGNGNDAISGGAGADNLTGGLGADTFVIGAAGDFKAGETIDGTAEPGTVDTLRLDRAATYKLSTAKITNVDEILINQNATGFNLTVSNDQVSSADADGDGVPGDLRIAAGVALTKAVKVSGAGLTNNNRIVVDGSNFGGADTLFGGSGDDAISSGSGSDTIRGGNGNDTINGGTGADNFTGELGADTFVISAAGDLGAGETINGSLEAGTTDTLRLDSAATYDLSITRVSNIDRIVLNQNAAGFVLKVVNGQVSTADSNHDGIVGDVLVDAGTVITESVTINASALTGANKILVDGQNLSGDDLIAGGAGNDTLNGGAGADTLNGGNGDDVLVGGEDVDLFSGGSGNDIVDYSAERGGTTGVQIDLGRELGRDSFGNLETLESIERVVGTSYGDTLTGGMANDHLEGLDGIDFLEGGAGDDRIFGGAGADVIREGLSSRDGNDFLDGGDGTDELRLYNPANEDVTVDLAAGFASGTYIGRNTLVSIENVTAGNGKVTLLGDNQSNELSGATGNDLLDGRAGKDKLAGYVGADIITGGAGDDEITGGAGDDEIDGGTEVDTAIYSALRSNYTVTYDGSAYTVIDTRAAAPDGTDKVTNVESFQFADVTLRTDKLIQKSFEKSVP